MRHSTLFSFGFAKRDYIPPVVLDLFAGYENTTVNGVPVWDYIFEVYEAVLDERIEIKNFNMIGYIKAIQQNNQGAEVKKARKVTFFKPEESDIEEKGVYLSQVKMPEDVYADYDDNDEVEWAVNKVNALFDELLIEYGVHIIHVMKRAAKGFPQAVEVLKRICDEIEELSELVYIILASGESLDELFPEEDTDKSEILSEVAKVLEERENHNDKVVSIGRGYDLKDENIQSMKKIGLDAYKVGSGVYIAFDTANEEKKKVSDVINF